MNPDRGPLCWACRDALPLHGRRCKACGSFQGVWRWFGETNLLSVVALLGTIVGILVGMRELRQTNQAIANVGSVVDSLQLADSLREELHSLGPSKERIAGLLRLFRYSSTMESSEEEAKRMVAFLNPLGMSERGRGAVSGTFGDPNRRQWRYEVTVWINSYDKRDTYGIRFGLEDAKYFGSNETYFEVLKVAPGQVMIAR